MVEKYAKILKLEGDLIDKSEKLRKVDTYCFEKGQVTKHFEELVMEVEDRARTLQGQLCALLNQVNSLSKLVDTLKADCTKAYQNGVSFVVSNLRTQVEKLDLTRPYFNLMRDFQGGRSKAPLIDTPQPSPRNTEVIPSGQLEGMVEEATRKRDLF